MKKALLFVSILAMLLMSAGCTNQDTDLQKAAQNKAAEETMEETKQEETETKNQDPQKEETKEEVLQPCDFELGEIEDEAITEKRPQKIKMNGVSLNSAEFLTQEQKELIVKAQRYMTPFLIGTGSFADNDWDQGKYEDIVVDEETYHKYKGKVYSGWEEFYEDMRSVFTEEFFEKLNTIEILEKRVSRYIEKDGELYYHDGDRGTNLLYLPCDRYSLISQTEDEIVLERHAYYASYEEFDRYVSDEIDYNEIPVEKEENSPVILKKTEDGWRVDKMELPY